VGEPLLLDPGALQPKAASAPPRIIVIIPNRFVVLMVVVAPVRLVRREAPR
jgi:hypothetical protein